MDIYNAFNAADGPAIFSEAAPPGMKTKFDTDILIPVVIDTKQLTQIAHHYKTFLKKNSDSMYLTYMFQHGTDATRGPHRFIITSLWAIKRDMKTFKEVGVPFNVMETWFNSEKDVKLLEKCVTLKEFKIEDVHKYIHYANVYLTETTAYVLHYKGQH